MATVQDLKTQIENANALGRTNLAGKGVVLPETATTYEIMQGIGNISSGGASLNIAYGETPPEDTSKLWIKANEPANVSVSSDFGGLGSISFIGNLSKKNENMGCAAVGTKIYLFGGTSDGYLNTINVFDSETKEITTSSTTLPTACYSMGCAAYGNKVYLFGGLGNGTRFNTINVFDTATETITTLSTTLPATCSKMGCARVGTKIYLFGGEGNGYRLKTINVFDTETEAITTLSTTLPTACFSIGCVSVGTKIYLFGGTTSGSLNTINVFDSETREITTLSTTLPTACYSMGCAAVGTKIYLFGGSTDSLPLNTICMFNTETEEIITLTTTIVNARSSMGCASVGNRVYLFGGYNGKSPTDIIEKFTVTHVLAQGNIEIQTDLFNNKFNLINTENAQVEIGVENVYVGNANNEAEPVSAYLYNGTEWKQIS